ncbi:TonB-denpendent receptor [Novosphingobium barchaimii LL02]|uniref:TonB-denpendent receptor n=1 Tax=Novosphingobium barchaimii LL02 TaxID=1114963 RepID=A0A0J7XWT0_9SPHN|nr:TonB-dependent receptor [Novosphingobium barchaimii]KMS56019.1 TonB-denpendent receptor [Novosphingobium barchaimii LL02]
MRVTQRAIQAMGDEMRVVRNGFFVGVWACALIGATPALAQSDQVLDFDLPAQSLTEALRAIARQSGLEFSAPADPLRGKRSPRLRGHFLPAEAARELLKGTNLVAEVIEGALIVRTVHRPQASVAAENEASENSEIVVTGSHLSKAESASPTIRLDANSIKLAGQTDLGQAIGSLPQNFSGGQNPGVLSGAVGSNNINLSSGSSANLRGLGGDATLTLLNGHRLAYGSVVQAVDLSAIPLAAVDRVEIVPDGASAIYGTDAVGGVVNVILKRNYEGATISSTIGGATSGGDFQQQYSVVAGKSWASGNVMAALSYDRNSEINSEDRTFTGYMPEGNTLFPRISKTSAILALNHRISPSINFSLDATYSHRTSFQSYAESPQYVYQNTPKSDSYSVTPSLRIAVSADWDLHLSSTYGRDRTKFDQAWVSDGNTMSHVRGCYCNELVGVETYASGPLFDINGAPIQVVAGGGYRYNSHKSVRYAATSPDSNGSVDSYYGFTETVIPLVTPGQNIPFMKKLEFDAALRFEHYPQIASVLVPKLGVIYGISDDLELKGTWGKSFKAPSLYDQFATNYSYLYQANYFGGERFPNGSTLLVDTGGSKNLKPEKATSWSTTATLHPRAIDGLRLNATYFHVDYRDRVVQPVAGTAIFRALSDASFSDFVTYDPNAAAIKSIIANSVQFYNYSGSSVIENVVAILHDRNTNAVRQRIEGVDLSVDYRLNTDSGSAFMFNANAAWLWSKQELTSDAGWMQLAGTIFNPARFKARASVGWTDGSSSALLYISHIAGITDNRTEPYTRLSRQTTFDFSMIYKSPARSGAFSGTSLTVNTQNIFDKKPPYAAPSGGYTYYANYDSTNFSAVGRFMSITLAKEF